jgi:hypothetical protein
MRSKVSSALAMVECLVQLQPIALLCTLLVLAMQSAATASTVPFQNTQLKAETYTVDYTDSNGGMGTITFLVDGLKTRDLGGPNGVGNTKGLEIKSYHTVSAVLASAGGGPVEFTPQWIDGSALSYTQTAPILAASDGVSGVYTYFDFNTPNYQELVANQSFVFEGFEGNRIPILGLTSDPTTIITNSSGQLLPQYQFTGATFTFGLNSIQPFSGPEPSTLTMSSVGIILFLGACLGKNLPSYQ